MISEELISSENNKQEVTIKTFKAEATVTPDGKLTAQLDSDNDEKIAPGEYKITLIIEEPTTPSSEEI
ncbi:hypothetical protein [Brasilonema sp. UFV-L1]|uniref:hypothetical protein n=1 Tax=Brasilonema sp. UFV-L1 TaxID=2234130 RepID=UPI00145E72E7|nr:hypothetical protein [Brasilonema sp. UFV-L1]NMG09212.1 hypothetical protein [Brasilonema sp. UFV-L1]